MATALSTEQTSMLSLDYISSYENLTFMADKNAMHICIVCTQTGVFISFILASILVCHIYVCHTEN